MFADGGLAATRLALHTIQGVGEGVLAGALGDTNALHANLVARLVHHGKHVVEATPLFPYQVANGAFAFTKTQGAGGRTMDAQLVLNGSANHIIALAQ